MHLASCPSPPPSAAVDAPTALRGRALPTAAGLPLPARRAALTAVLLGLLCAPSGAGAFSSDELADEEPPPSPCVTCHRDVTPGVVTDWEISKHHAFEVGCVDCHGEEHTTADDAAEAAIPTPDTCATCHADRVEQFSRGKHAFAWAAMKAMPTAHWQPMSLMEGQKGCGGCHKIGLKTEAEIAELSTASGGYGVASCDACHTRHTFSPAEAREPQACQTCHMGFDHPQWEMYSSSKHGVRHSLKRLGVLPNSAAAPTCQTCHMPGGDHEVRTAWGFLAVRLPLPDDPQWAADRTTILQALGVLDPDGKPTARLEVVKAADLARLTEEAWQAERDEMIGICTQCHAGAFARQQLAQGDEMIRQADRVMAEAIRIVADLYREGVIAKPAAYAHPFPDLLAFHDSATSIEQKLWVMFLEHRMRAFQGTFHASPDYALWYGWSEMQRGLVEIREEAGRLRREQRERRGDAP